MSNGFTGSKGFYGWINLAVCAVIGVVAGFYIVAFSYFLPFLIKDFGWNRGTASYAATINLIALGISGPIAGMFIGRYGARRSIVLGNVMGCLGFLLLYFHSQLWQLFLGWGLLVGTGAGFGGMLATTTVVNNWFVRKRHLALSLFLASGGAGGVVMGPALMRMIETFGWRTTSLAIALMVLVFAVFLPALLIRNKPQDLGQAPDGPAESKGKGTAGAMPPKAGYKTPVEFTLGEALRTRCLWLLIAYFCMNMLAMQALMTHQVAYLFDIGIGATLAAAALSVMSGVMAFGQLSVGYLGSKFGVQSIAIAGELFKIAGMVLVLYARTAPSVFLYMVVLGWGFGLAMAATMNMFPNYYGALHYPKIMGLIRLFWTFAGGLGAPIAGFIRESTGSYIPAFQLAIAVIVAGLCCLIFAKPPVHPSLRKTGAAALDASASR
jgi:MFS family permease